LTSWTSHVKIDRKPARLFESIRSAVLYDISFQKRYIRVILSKASSKKNLPEIV